VFGVPKATWVQIVLVVITMGLATASVVAGLDAGIKRLSEINIALAVALMILILALGPTVLLMQTFMQNTGSYVSEIVSKTFNPGHLCKAHRASVRPFMSPGMTISLTNKSTVASVLKTFIAAGPFSASSTR